MRAHSAAAPTSPSASNSTLVSTAGPVSSQPGVDKRAKKRSLTFSSARTSPPPDFLLDDDPFANLTSAPSERTTPAETIPTPSIPHSPLNSKVSVPVITSPPSIPSTRTRPAHQRPAFKSRPSLPSLDTLARMNVVLTKKVRKGRVGAGLPFEPWDNLPSQNLASQPISNPQPLLRVK
ncbi:hypothetical protein BJ912DRAFT_597830 [Pholiota molesta]|nr:hypothetical protein BJ912DRAFT_597830 [Pholiota molesta]